MKKEKRNNSITYYNLPLHFSNISSNKSFKLARTNRNGSKPISKFLRLSRETFPPPPP